MALKLLEQVEVREHAQADDNFVLRLACRNGMPEVAMKLLELDKVKEKAHVGDNEALKLACLWDLEIVAMKLLDQQEVRDHLDSNNAIISLILVFRIMEKTYSTI